MTFLGEKNELYETVIFGILTGVTFAIMLVQVIYLQKLKSLSVRVLPLLTVLVSYENACSGAGDSIDGNSIFSKFSVIVIAAILPLFFVVLFELPFRLHEARSAHFMCIPFEQGEVMAGTIATVSLVTVRVFAVGIFVINALVNLDLLNDENNRAGLGGYANAKEELESVHFWLSIVPSLALSVLALFISVLMQRYARNFTLGIRNSNHYFRYMLPCSILYTIGHCFGAHIYRWTSLAGDVFLVIGISIMVQRVQSDLAVAGSFADFLHRSNAVFRTSHSQETDRKLHHHHHHPHHHHHHHNHMKQVEGSGNMNEHEHVVTPDSIHLDQLENGDIQLQQLETAGDIGVNSATVEIGDHDDTHISESRGVTSTALVKGELILDDDGDEEPELHAL